MIVVSREVNDKLIEKAIPTPEEVIVQQQSKPMEGKKFKFTSFVSCGSTSFLITQTTEEDGRDDGSNVVDQIERVGHYSSPTFVTSRASIAHSHYQYPRCFTTIKNEHGSITASKEEDEVRNEEIPTDLDISKFTKEVKIDMPEIIYGQSTAKLV